MAAAARRRLAVVEGHFDLMQGAAGSGRSGALQASAVGPAVAGLQQLLDHDNHELRKRMKDFFQSDDIYIPR